MDDAQLLLWDIDGTLLSCGSAPWHVFEQVVAEQTGRPFVHSTASFDGRTDPFIARQLLVANGCPDDELEASIKAVLRRLGPAMSAIRDLIVRDGHVHPGVVNLLAALSRTPVFNGVVTGNLAVNAVLKLSLFGLDDVINPEFGGFGSDSENRAALVDVARKRLEKKFHPVDPEDIWIIGDTPHDFAVAKDNGTRCLLVATGAFSYEELAKLGADAVMHDLTNTEAAMALLMPSYAKRDVEVGDT